MPYVTSVERIGERKGLCEGIAAAFEMRFGKPDKAFLQEIQAVYDAAKLRKVLRALTTGKTLEQIRRLLG